MQEQVVGGGGPRIVCGLNQLSQSVIGTGGVLPQGIVDLHRLPKSIILVTGGICQTFLRTGGGALGQKIAYLIVGVGVLVLGAV